MATKKVITGTRFYIGGPITASELMVSGDFAGQVWTEVSGLRDPLPDLTVQRAPNANMTLNDKMPYYTKQQGAVGTAAYSFDIDPLDPGQLLMGLAFENECFDYAFKITDGVQCGFSGVVSIASGTPGVVTWPGCPLVDDDQVIFEAPGGSLPTGLSAATAYYVVSQSGDTFEVSATKGGSAINVSGAGDPPFIARQVVSDSGKLFASKVFARNEIGGSRGDIIGVSFDVVPQYGVVVRI